MAENGNGNGNGNGRVIPNVLPIPAEGIKVVTVKVGSVPRETGDITLTLDSRFLELVGVRLLPDTIERGRLDEKCANDMVYTDVEISSDFVLPQDGIAEAHITICDDGSDILTSPVSFAAEGSREVIDAFADPAAQQIVAHRNAFRELRLREEAAKLGNGSTAGGDRPADGTKVEVVEQTTSARGGEIVDAEIVRETDRATDTHATPSATPAAEHAATRTDIPQTPGAAPQVTVRTANGGTTVTVDVATGEGNRVSVGAITIDPVADTIGGRGSGTASGTPAVNGSTAAQTASDSWSVSPCRLPLDGCAHTLTVEGKGIPRRATVTFSSSHVQLRDKIRRSGGSLTVPVRTARLTHGDVEDGEITVQVTVEWDGEQARTLPGTISLEPMATWRGGYATLAFTVAAVVAAVLLIGLIILGADEAMLKWFGPLGWGFIAASLASVYTYRLRYGKPVTSGWGVFASLFTLIALIATFVALIGGM